MDPWEREGGEQSDPSQSRKKQRVGPLTATSHESTIRFGTTTWNKPFDIETGRSLGDQHQQRSSREGGINCSISTGKRGMHLEEP